MSLFRKITETVSKGVSTATEKAQQTVEITRLHAQISGKRKEIEKRYMEIGEIVFDGFAAGNKASGEAKVNAICEEIAAVFQEIEVLDERIMQLRNEKECECGRKVTYDTRFCPSCGHKFPDPVLERADAAGQQGDTQPYEADGAPDDAFGAVSGSPEPDEERSASDWADVGAPILNAQPDAGWTSRENPADRTAETAACLNCSASVEVSARFCPSCGTPRRT